MALMKQPKATSLSARTRASKSFSTGWYDWKENRRKPARMELATIMCPSDASNTLTSGESTPSMSSLRLLSPRLVVTVVVVTFFAGPSFTTVVVGIVVVVVCMGMVRIGIVVVC